MIRGLESMTTPLCRSTPQLDRQLGQENNERDPSIQQLAVPNNHLQSPLKKDYSAYKSKEVGPRTWMPV